MPSLVQASEEFHVNALQDVCWTFFSNLENIGLCIPGCEAVTRIDDTSGIFKVKLKVGYLSKTFELKAKIKESIPPSHLVFTGEGSDAEINGRLDIIPDEAGASIKYGIEIVPISVTGKTAIALIGKDLVRKQTSEFAGCVKTKLESG